MAATSFGNMSPQMLIMSDFVICPLADCTIGLPGLSSPCLQRDIKVALSVRQLFSQENLIQIRIRKQQIHCDLCCRCRWTQMSHLNREVHLNGTLLNTQTDWGKTEDNSVPMCLQWLFRTHLASIFITDACHVCSQQFDSMF